MCFVGIVATGFWKRKEKRTRKGYIEEKENGQCFGDCRHRAKDRKADTLRKKKYVFENRIYREGYERKRNRVGVKSRWYPNVLCQDIYIYI